MFLAAASPQEAEEASDASRTPLWHTPLDCPGESCRVLYHILGIADAAKETYLPFAGG